MSSHPLAPLSHHRRLLSHVAAGALLLGASLGLAPVASAEDDPAPIVTTPAVIVATAPSSTIAFSAPVPTSFTPTYAGYETGEGPTTAPTCSTTATDSSPAGAYPVTCVGGDATVAGNTAHTYSFDYVAGTLTVAAALCNDGVDNDGNALTDFPQDLGCSSSTDDTETSTVPCSTRSPVVGNAKNNFLFGSRYGDNIFGRDGHDSLFGLAGNDCLFGEGGLDSLYGDVGNDFLDGGNAGGLLWGGDGNDVLYGGSSSDGLTGGDGNDLLNGGGSSDALNGGAGEDRIVARDGFLDFIDCGAGNDVAYVDADDRVKNCETRIVLGN